MPSFCPCICSLKIIHSQYEACECLERFLIHFSFFFNEKIGKHLAEHCRAEYEKVPNFILWMLAELAVIACDIPEGILSLSFPSLFLVPFRSVVYQSSSLKNFTGTAPNNNKLK